MTFEELMALPDEEWDKVCEAIITAIREQDETCLDEHGRVRLSELVQEEKS